VVTDYIQGPSLQQILLDQLEKGNFEMPKLIQMMAEIAQAVDYIHTHGIVHQNIKPSNIVYDPTTNRLRLIDFAFSCSQHLNAQCKGKAGTVYYMPPELVELQTDPSEQDFALRAAHDVWSMGVVFYQMANLGQDFMNFTNNDPVLITKEIQINDVKPSNYPYSPINSVIDTMLKKNSAERPTAGQVVILISLARPLCIVNDQPYDRRMAEALVTSLGLDINPDTDDHTLCSTLTDHLNICKIRNSNYQKEHLVELAKILGINVSKAVESAELCNTIQKGLQTQQDQYSEYVTLELLRALEYMAFIQARAASEVTGELKDILEQLQKRYSFVYNEAKKLDIINLKLLEARRMDVTRKSLVYAQNVSITYARVYGLLAEKIVQVILSVNPNAEVGDVPLATFQKKVTGDILPRQ
jgi:serine/threonine protein kinase